MKHKLLFILMTFIVAQTNAQEAKPKTQDAIKRNAIKINPISPFLDCIQISFLHRTSEDVALNFSLGYMNYVPSDNFSTYKNERTVAFFFAPEIRYYLDYKNVENLYISGFARIINMQFSGDVDIITQTPFTPIYTRENRTATYNSLGFGLLIGKEFTYKNRVIIDGFVGPIYSFLVTEQNGFPKNTSFYNNNSSDNELKIAQVFSDNMLRRYSLRAGVTIGYMF